MLLSSNNVEKILQKSLPYFFILVFITTIAGALSGYVEHNSWKMGDWLINYQGGMVRRGLLGEMLYQLSYLTHINPGLYATMLQVFFYGVFLFFSYALLRQQRSLLPYAFLIFSPFIFTFQINDLQGGFRKEIIYLALLAFVVWSTRNLKPKFFEKEIVKIIRQNLKNYETPTWLKLNKEKLEAKIIRLPNKEEISVPVEMRAIFEFYAK